MIAIMVTNSWYFELRQYHMVDPGYPNMQVYLVLYRGSQDYRSRVKGVGKMRYLAMHTSHYETLP